MASDEMIYERVKDHLETVEYFLTRTYNSSYPKKLNNPFINFNTQNNDETIYTEYDLEQEKEEEAENGCDDR